MALATFGRFKGVTVLESHTSELWQEILSIIQTKLSKPSFDTWFKATKALTITDHSVVISAPTTFAVEWLESRYTKLVSATVLEVVGKQVDVRFVIEEAKGHEPVPRRSRRRLKYPGKKFSLIC